MASTPAPFLGSDDATHEQGSQAGWRDGGSMSGRDLSRPASPPGNHSARPTSSSSSSSASQSPYFSSLPSRSAGPLASRRARQIQADEGIVPAPYRPPAMRQGASNTEQAGTLLHSSSNLDLGRSTTATLADNDPHPIGSRLFRGRVRAGTLPSSWGNEAEFQPLSTLPLGSQQGTGGAIGDGSSGKGDQAWSPSLSQHGAVPPNSEALRRSNSGAPSSLFGYGSILTSGQGFGSTRMAASRQLRSNSTLEYDQRGGLYSHLGSDASAPSTFSPSSSIDTSGAANRHRSGSLASTSSGLGSNAFGPSIFTSTWADQPSQGRLVNSTMNPLSRQNSTNVPNSAMAEATLGRNRLNFAQDNDVPSLHDEPPLNTNHEVHTLDYLGLDEADSYRSSLGPLRNRASTLASAPLRGNVNSLTPSHHLGMPPAEPTRQASFGDGILANDAATDEVLASYGLQHGLDASQLAAVASAVGLQTGNGSSQPGRLRAGTVAALSGPGGRQRIEQELRRMTNMINGAGLSGLGINSLLVNSHQGMAGGENRYSRAPLEGFPHLEISTPPATTPSRSSPFQTSPSTPASLNKAVTVDDGLHPTWNSTPSGNAHAPGSVDPSVRSTNQTPSRSLWVGNLDSSTTGQELMRVFAPYGAIESLRLLPEKECGFVNFIEISDAVRAREDVLGRLGAKLEHLGTGTGGTVRIGYGKIDSAPRHSFRNGTGAGKDSGLLAAQGHDGLHASTDTGSHPMTPGASEGVGPTRALWVGSIPNSVTPALLLSIFQPFGPVESARILTHRNCGFINFERVDDAVRARKMLNGRDVLGSEVGAMRIGFAKVPVRNVEAYPAEGVHYNEAMDSLAALKGAKSVAKTAGQQHSGGLENYRSNLVVNLLNQRELDTGLATDAQPSSLPVSRHGATSSSSSIVPASEKGGVPLPPHMAAMPSLSDLQLLMSQLSADQASQEADVASVAEHRPSSTYYMTIPLVSEVSSGRRFETSKLRETRRSIESGQVGTQECDQLAFEYLDSIVDLASDYIGNTLVQKFFEHCSEKAKMDMLRRLTPHLAMTGCHKNGTWAAQKILDCSRSIEQITLIAQHLRPYIPGLLLDQFGNYVVQCCLPWMQPLNDFVFDAMVDRCWEIAQGRFGARSMRACLEKNSVTDQQRKRVAMAVILNSVPLATSPNGSILLTWLLETSGLSRSYKLLAPRFAPHLSHLCTHKLASTPVMRLVNQKVEPEASQTILDALFQSSGDQVLEEVVVDQVHGSQFVTKVLASPVLTREQRDQYAGQVRVLVDKHRLVGVPAYRRLCEDLGLLAPTFHASVAGAPPAMSQGGAQYAPAPTSGPAPYPTMAPTMGSHMGSMPPDLSGMPGNMAPPLHPTLGLIPPQDAFNPCWDATSPLANTQHSSGRTNQ